MQNVWDRLRQRDYLAELQAILTAALVAGVIAALASMTNIAFREPITVTVASAELTQPGTIEGLAVGSHIDRAAGLQVVIDRPSVRQLAWHTAKSLPWFAIAMFTLVMLLLIVRTARRDDPFSVVNVRRLKAVGWVMTVGSAIAFYVEFVAGFELSATVATASASTRVEFPLGWFFGGFCFLALSEIIKRGSAMRADLAGVV